MPTYTLGISAFSHDSAAALVADGLPVAAAQEERFTRVRHDPGFPRHAVGYCLDEAGIALDDLAAVVYHEDPALKFRRVLSSFASAGLGGWRAGTAVLPQWLGWKRHALTRVDDELAALGRGRAPRARSSRHHRSHAASAFFPSPFPSAAVLTVDGVGEWQTTTLWHGRDNSLDLVDSISYPHSLGLLYSAFTYYCGFKVDSGEYKLMGLAPYGQPVYADLIRDRLINLRADGSFTLDMRYFEYVRGRRMVGRAFEKLFGGPIRSPESALTQRQCDLAASVQRVVEEAVLGLAKAAVRGTGERRLCLAGGVALNCVANGVLSRSGVVDALWIQPAAGDAGCALGAALDHAVRTAGRPHLASGRDAMRGALLGPGFPDEEIERFLVDNGYRFEKLDEEAVYDRTSGHLADGAVVGWFQGRMEFGPRALGARSILGDPRDPGMQKRMNLKIKFRESFRPFAPAVLAEDAADYFDIPGESPYMLVVHDVADRITTERVRGAGPDRGPGDRTGSDAPNRPDGSRRSDGSHGPGGSPRLGSLDEVRSELPAVTHVDLSARVQTVSERDNGPLTRLLRRFKERTGCPVLVNTSFNVRGEPIVRTPAEAYRCFMRTGMDVLVLGSFVLRKEDQPPYPEAADWRERLPLD